MHYFYLISSQVHNDSDTRYSYYSITTKEDVIDKLEKNKKKPNLII